MRENRTSGSMSGERKRGDRQLAISPRASPRLSPYMLAVANGWGSSDRIAGSRSPRYIFCMNARPADRLAIALAQLNATVGDVAGNAAKVRRARATAAGQ